MKCEFNHKGFFDKEAAEMRERILNTPNTEELYEIKGTKYYVSNNGCDCNDGLSPETAKRTLDGAEDLPLKEGDALLFERGSTFRIIHQFNTVGGVIYGSYGEGEKPKIYGSEKNFANAIWKKSSRENVWETNVYYHTYVGGVIINDGEYIGVCKWSVADLSENEHFYFNQYYKKLYLYCDKGNPADIFDSIEVNSDLLAMVMDINTHNNTFDNLCLKHFFYGIYPHNLNHGITVTNCEFAWIGGSGGKTVRHGNAVQSWNGGADFIVRNNWFHQTFDSAVSWQGHIKQDMGIEFQYKNIHFSDNLFEYNNCDIEFFDRAGTTLEDFYMENNLMRFTSMGWGTISVEGKIRGIEGCIRAHTNGMDKVENTYFTNNIMDCPARQTINWDVDPWQLEGIHASGTKLYIKPEYRTLKPYLQGLQNEEGLAYDRRFAETTQELIEGFKIFEDGADIYVEE